MPNATAGGARVVHVPAAAGHGDQRIAAERAPASYTAEKGAASSRMKAGVSYRIVYSVPDGQHHTLTAVAVYWLPTANKEVQKRKIDLELSKYCLDIGRLVARVYGTFALQMA